MYIPPHEQINEIELENLTKQLAKSFILLSNFNSHSTLEDKTQKQNRTTDKQSKGDHTYKPNR